MTIPVHAVFPNFFDHEGEAPSDIQYMPPGRHRINGSRAGKPVALDVLVDAQAAEALDAFLKTQLSKAEKGSEDRPYFDFNHEDREASAWPTEFYWAGEDLQTGGVRVKLEWSGAGRKAVQERTFRRFSPTFIPDDQGRVVGSTTNMGGLVNRAAFKAIQPLFAREAGDDENPGDASMNRLIETLKDVGLVTAAVSASDAAAVAEASREVKASIAKLRGELEAAKSRRADLEAKLSKVEEARLSSIVDAAVSAGRIAPSDEASKAFWLEALKRDEKAAAKALEALPANPVLAAVTDGHDRKLGLLDKMSLQQQKLVEVQAANPGASFETIFAKAQAEAPQLFS